MKTKIEIRNSFWNYLKEVNPELAQQRRSNKKQNQYCCDIRQSFCDYIENLRCDNIITEKMSNSITL